MINPYFSIILSLSVIPSGLTSTQKLAEPVLTNEFSEVRQSQPTTFKQDFNSFSFYTNYHLPKITQAKVEEQKKLEQERLEKERVAREAAEAAERERLEQEKLAEQERQRQLAIQRQQAAKRVLPAASNAGSAANAAVSAGFDYVSLIRERCAQLGCNSDQLIRVMYCESGGRANAKNPSSDASGLFQFMPRTFAVNAQRAGVGGASIWDARAQIIVATYMFANGQAGQWSCK
jgi:soluble lytic murein transglycosylase-like protein